MARYIFNLITLFVLMLSATINSYADHVVINFDDLPQGGITGVVVSNQYPSVTFSSTSGNVNYVTTQPNYNGSKPNFICTGPAGGAINCTAETILDFTSPVNNLTFNGMGINDNGTVAKIDVYESGKFSATVNVVGHASGTNPELQDLKAFHNVTKIRIYSITDGGGIGWDDFVFDSAAITEVQLQAINSPLDTNPNTGGGIRIFPDKQTPGDTMERRTVKVRALTNASKGQTIYFKSFDVDDPASDTAPIDPNGADGNDNRGANPQGILSAATATTNDNGTAEVTLTVSTQPGDNFMVVASLSQDYLNGITEKSNILKDAKGKTLPTDSARASKMLTVWRHVHIEVDSMGLVHDNYLSGTVKGTAYVPLLDRTILVLDKTPEIGRFENGAIYIDNDAGHSLISYFGTLVTIKGKINATNKSYRLVDDDDMFDQFGALPTGDDGLQVPLPDTSLLQTSDDPVSDVFAPAYVVPVYDIDHTSRDATFTLNSTEVGLIGNYKYDNIATARDNNFWTVYLLGCYQFETNSDGDPNSEGVVFGIVDDIKGLGANIFTEALSSHELTTHGLSGRPAVSKAATVAHEIGHLFNGQHTDLGLMSQSGSRTTTAFSDISIDKIRSLDRP